MWQNNECYNSLLMSLTLTNVLSRHPIYPIYCPNPLFSFPSQYVNVFWWCCTRWKMWAFFGSTVCSCIFFQSVLQLSLLSSLLFPGFHVFVTSAALSPVWWWVHWRPFSHRVNDQLLGHVYILYFTWDLSSMKTHDCITFYLLGKQF